MTSEPLTVDELERAKANWEKAALCLHLEVDPSIARDVKAAGDRYVQAIIESHSRQLWLEAAEEATKWATRYELEFSRDEARVLRSFGEWLRAKAESTPKPSPALPEKP